MWGREEWGSRQRLLMGRSVSPSVPHNHLWLQGSLSHSKTSWTRSRETDIHSTSHGLLYHTGSLVYHVACFPPLAVCRVTVVGFLSTPTTITLSSHSFVAYTPDVSPELQTRETAHVLVCTILLVNKPALHTYVYHARPALCMSITLDHPCACLSC